MKLITPKTNKISRWVALLSIALLIAGYSFQRPFFISGAYNHPPVKPDPLPLGDFNYFKEHAQWLIKKTVAEEEIQSLSVAFIYDQKIIWTEGFGHSDMEKKIPTTPQTVYRTGPASETLVSLAIFKLIEAGKIDLDDTLEELLPDFSIQSQFEAESQATLRSLLTHHAGLPLVYMREPTNPHEDTLEGLLGPLAEEYTSYPANLIFQPSVVGLSLAGLIIERHGGVPFSEYMEQEILIPLGMHESAFGLPEHLRPLTVNQGQDPMAYYSRFKRNAPAFSFHSNVLDLSRMLQMLFAQGKHGSQPFLQADSVQTMLSPQQPSQKFLWNVDVGLGWWIPREKLDILGRQTWSGFVGGLGQSRGGMAMMTEHGLGVVILAHVQSGDDPLQDLASELLQNALEIKTGVPILENLPYFPEIELPQATLESYAGHYVINFDGGYQLAKVVLEGEYLNAYTQSETLRLVPHANRVFSGQPLFLDTFPIPSLEFLSMTTAMDDSEWFQMVSIDGKVMVYSVQDFGQGAVEPVGTKVSPAPIPHSWKNRLGVYHALDGAPPGLEKFSLTQKEGFLLFQRGTEGHYQEVVLSPQSDEVAFMVFLVEGMGPTFHIRSLQNQEVLQFYGVRYQKED